MTVLAWRRHEGVSVEPERSFEKAVYGAFLAWLCSSALVKLSGRSVPHSALQRI
jgi:hypothetical protein